MNYAVFLVALATRAVTGQGQLYYGFYFGCRPDYTLCIQVQVLADSWMRIETFSDSWSLARADNGDKVIDFFPSVSYGWRRNEIVFAEQASGLEYSFHSDKSHLISSVSEIEFSARTGDFLLRGAKGDLLFGEATRRQRRSMSVNLVSSTQLRMLGVDLHYYSQPHSWSDVARYSAQIYRWRPSEGNMYFLSYPLESWFNYYHRRG